MEVTGLQCIESTNPHCISYDKGTLINVLEMSDTGLWKGTCNDQTGLFDVSCTTTTMQSQYLFVSKPDGEDAH